MAILHAYNQTVADGTATSVIRPSDWNSQHNVNYALGGNTVGSASVSGQDVAFFGGNNVTLSADTLNSRLYISGANTVAQSVQTQASGNIAGAGFTTTTASGAVLAATHNSAGILMAVPAYLTTAQSPGAYLTTARASNDAVGLNTALTANGVAWTVNSSGISLNVPAFLTTAAQSTHSHNLATTTTAGSNIVVGTANSAGATIGVPAFITTAALSQNTSNYAGVGTTFAGTNATATLAANTNGVALSLSVAGGGVVNQTGPNIAVAGSTVTSGDVYFSNSPTVTFGMNGSTITASAAGGGGGGQTIAGAELFQLNGNTTFSTLGQNSIYFQKFIAQSNVSFNNFERRATMSSASSSIAANANYTLDYGMYSKGTGASTSIYNLIASSRMILQASYSSNLSAGYTVSQGAASVTNTSAGTVNMSALSGFKHFYMPFTNTITAGGEYAVAMNLSSATTGNTGPLRIGFKEMTNYSNLSVGRVGVTEGISISAASRVGDWGQGVYSATSAGLPATLAISGLTNAVSQARMYLQFDV